jgi:hypothetical protein
VPAGSAAPHGWWRGEGEGRSSNLDPSPARDPVRERGGGAGRGRGGAASWGKNPSHPGARNTAAMHHGECAVMEERTAVEECVMERGR